jgi:hypothetical protein
MTDAESVQERHIGISGSVLGACIDAFHAADLTLSARTSADLHLATEVIRLTKVCLPLVLEDTSGTPIQGWRPARGQTMVLLGLNVTVLRPLILIFSPVWGFRPIRVFR